MALLDHRGRAGAIQGQKEKTFFLTFKSQNLGKNYKKYIENQCFLVQLVKKLSLLLLPGQVILIFSSV